MENIMHVVGVGIARYAQMVKRVSFWFEIPEQLLYRGLIIGVGYVFFLLVFLFLWKWVKKTKNGLEKSLVTQIDEMIFLLAKYQHDHVDTKQLGGNPHLALMRSIFAEGECDYINSSTLILENMHKVQQLLGQQLISQERELAFVSDLRRFYRFKGGERVLRWVLAILTLGGVLLFA